MAVDFDLPVDFPDEIVHIRHHFHRAGDGQVLQIAVPVLNAVDHRVHVVALDDGGDKRHDVVRLNILQCIDFGHHVILRIILNEPESPCSFFFFRRAKPDRSAKNRQDSDSRQHISHSNFPPLLQNFKGVPPFPRISIEPLRADFKAISPDENFFGGDLFV